VSSFAFSFANYLGLVVAKHLLQVGV